MKQSAITSGITQQVFQADIFMLPDHRERCLKFSCIVGIEMK